MTSLRDERIGKVHMQNCGLKAKIIDYRNAHDMDVEFSDGKKIEHRSYKDFMKGRIKHTNFKEQAEDRVGETEMQKCGLEAEIINYRGSNDINVRFSDNETVEHRTYNCFKKGQIQHPKIDRYKDRRKDKTHEIRMQNCGLEAEIISYRNSSDMDIRFSDGQLVEHKTYQNFIKGEIRHPDIDPHKHWMSKYADTVIGNEHIQNCGLIAKIIDYETANDISVQFQDGVIVRHKRHDSFKRGQIAHPTLNRNFYGRTKKIYNKPSSRIYHTQIHGIACITNDTYYYYAHCPICQAHEIWTFNEIKGHMCNQALVQERDTSIQTHTTSQS